MGVTKAHWENIYAIKQPNEVSWTQLTPQPSLSLIQLLNPDREDAIIDIGGGDSQLVDRLLNLGFTNITVLDISGKALERAQLRLGKKAALVTWIESDIRNFAPTQQYAIWHDRAAFHFLTEKAAIANYISVVDKHVSKGIILGTFSDSGPLKCSGLDVSRYSPLHLTELFLDNFEQQKAYKLDHQTPFNSIQNFSFYVGKKTK